MKMLEDGQQRVITGSTPATFPRAWKTNLNLAAVQGWIIVVSPKYICEMEVAPILSQKTSHVEISRKEMKKVHEKLILEIFIPI